MILYYAKWESKKNLNVSMYTTGWATSDSNLTFYYIMRKVQGRLCISKKISTRNNVYSNVTKVLIIQILFQCWDITKLSLLIALESILIFANYWWIFAMWIFANSQMNEIYSILNICKLLGKYLLYKYKKISHMNGIL